MGFRLKSGQAISSEVRRIVLRQLDLATSELKSIGDPESDEAIHDARRRVKKIRAVIRLVRPVLDKTYRVGVDPDLRRVSKMLAPVADGQGVIDTLNVLARRYRKALPRKAVAALRADLIEREKRIDAKADAQHVLQKATRALRAQRKQIKAWKLTAEGFHAIAPGLKESVRRARHAMTAAWNASHAPALPLVAPLCEGSLVSRPAARGALRQPLDTGPAPPRSARWPAGRVPQPRAAAGSPP